MILLPPHWDYCVTNFQVPCLEINWAIANIPAHYIRYIYHIEFRSSIQRIGKFSS